MADNVPDEIEDFERKSRVEEAWKKMNSGLPDKKLPSLVGRSNSSTKQKTSKTPPNWMAAFGIAPKKTLQSNQPPPQDVTPGSAIDQHVSQNNTSSGPLTGNVGNEDATKLAAAALAAVREAAQIVASAKGKVEITEVRDFAGEEVKVKKLVDENSAEATEKAAGSTVLDSVLEQIKKKPKLSVMDKTKKDWGEYKGDNKSVEEELDAYKKSSNKYLDKVSFLHRTDYREFERERDARLALQAKRKAETRD